MVAKIDRKPKWQIEWIPESRIDWIPKIGKSIENEAIETQIDWNFKRLNSGHPFTKLLRIWWFRNNLFSILVFI